MMNDKILGGISMQLNELWENTRDALDPFDQDTLAIIEEKLQLKLPADYVHLMKMQNGGYLRRDTFKIKDEEIIVEELYGISANDEEGILTTIDMREEWELPEDIILLSGDGHTWLFLDYRKKLEQPSVSYIDLESEIDFVLASNFTDFINGLYKDDSLEEIEFKAEGVYMEDAFERIVEEGEDAFELTDGVLYFIEADCDMKWLIRQVNRMMDIDNDESEFILPEVLYYLINRIQEIHLNDEVSEVLDLLARNIKEHKIPEVRKYHEKIKGIIE